MAVPAIPILVPGARHAKAGRSARWAILPPSFNPSALDLGESLRSLCRIRSSYIPRRGPPFLENKCSCLVRGNNSRIVEAAISDWIPRVKPSSLFHPLASLRPPWTFGDGVEWRSRLGCQSCPLLPMLAFSPHHPELPNPDARGLFFLGACCRV